MGGRGFVAGAVEATLFELLLKATNNHNKGQKVLRRRNP